MKDKFLNIINTIAYFYKKVGLKFTYFITKHSKLLIGILITLLSLLARYLVCEFPTNDVVGYVFLWMKQIEEVGFNNFYKVEADYSPLFLFITGLFTYLPKGNEMYYYGQLYYSNWMYYLKSIYFFMDVLIAFGLFLNIKYLTKSNNKAFIGYIIFLCLPVQFFNTAIWGNSDSMYFACFIYIIYFILKRKDGLAFFLLGIALGLKLQAVFILPFIVYLLVRRELHLYKLILIPLGLISTFIPAYLCGASFVEPFYFIGRQVGGYNKLTLGCANIWHLINVPDQYLDIFNRGSTVLGLLLIGLFVAIVYLRNIELTDINKFCICVFLIAIVPMFLPHMHERYFYSLDVLLVIYCLVKGKKYYLIPLMQISSGIAYHNYLAGYHFIGALGEDSVHISSWINIAILTIIFLDILKLERINKTKEEELLDIKRELEELKR